MKNHVRTFALSLPLVLAGAGSALAAEAGAAADTPVTCSEATLRGTYLFATNGLTVHGKSQVPFAASCSARPKEKLTCHGWGPSWLMASKFAVA